MSLHDMETRARIHPISHSVRGLSRILIGLFAAFPAMACQNAAILRSSGHLELGVRFSTDDPWIIKQASLALQRWSEIADLSWHRDNSSNCSIDIKAGTFTDEDEVAQANAEDGSITFLSAGELTAHELFITAFHEIGHLLGLQHNSNPNSVMYWIDFRGDEVLDASDMRALAATHAIRAGSKTSGIHMAGWQSVSIEPSASGSSLESRLFTRRNRSDPSVRLRSR